jgi:hypothetical protein
MSVHAMFVNRHAPQSDMEVAMRYLTILNVCLLTLTTLGCSNQTPQPAAGPAEENTPSVESAPASNNTADAAVEPASETANEEGGFNLDIDVGQDGVRVETKGPNEKSGLKVDVDPDGQVDVEVGNH